MSYRTNAPPPDDRIPEGSLDVGDGYLHPLPHVCPVPGPWERFVRRIHEGRMWTCKACFQTFTFRVAFNEKRARWHEVDET